MKWYGISGSWRTSSAELRRDVRTAVTEAMHVGDGIVSGGALGVDLVATKEALIHNPKADRIKIIIPSSLEVFDAHYRKRADEGVITKDQAEELVDLLAKLKSKNALQEMSFLELNEESYYARNTEVLKACDELLVFQVNGSLGTQDTIDKARAMGLKIQLKQYVIKL